MFEMRSQHNTLADVKRILTNFAASDATFLLLGSYPTAVSPSQIGYSPQKAGTNMDIQTGGYMRINLESPPFNLKPQAKYPEGTADEKYLYLYKRTAVAEALGTEGYLGIQARLNRHGGRRRGHQNSRKGRHNGRGSGT